MNWEQAAFEAERLRQTGKSRAEIFKFLEKVAFELSPRGNVQDVYPQNNNYFGFRLFATGERITYDQNGYRYEAGTHPK